MFDWNEADVLRKLRAETGIMIERLATESGVSITTINRIEMRWTETPDRETVKKLAAVFGLAVEEFYACIPHKHPGVTIRVSDSKLNQWKGERKRTRRKHIAVS